MITSITFLASTPRSLRPRSGGWSILRPRRAPTLASNPVSMTNVRAFERAKPDEIVEIARALVRVAADEVLARLAVREARVLDREDFVGFDSGSPSLSRREVGPTAGARLLQCLG